MRLQPTPSFQSHGTGKLLTHKLQVSCPWQGAAEVLSKSSDQKRARIRSSLGHAARSLRSPLCLLGDSISQHTAFESTCLTTLDFSLLMVPCYSDCSVSIYRILSLSSPSVIWAESVMHRNTQPCTAKPEKRRAQPTATVDTRRAR